MFCCFYYNNNDKKKEKKQQKIGKIMKHFMKYLNIKWEKHISNHKAYVLYLQYITRKEFCNYDGNLLFCSLCSSKCSFVLFIAIPNLLFSVKYSKNRTNCKYKNYSWIEWQSTYQYIYSLSFSFKPTQFTHAVLKISTRHFNLKSSTNFQAQINIVITTVKKIKKNLICKQKIPLNHLENLLPLCSGIHWTNWAQNLCDNIFKMKGQQLHLSMYAINYKFLNQKCMHAY